MDKNIRLMNSFLRLTSGFVNTRTVLVMFTKAKRMHQLFCYYDTVSLFLVLCKVFSY